MDPIIINTIVVAPIIVVITWHHHNGICGIIAATTTRSTVRKVRKLTNDRNMLFVIICFFNHSIIRLDNNAVMIGIAVTCTIFWSFHRMSLKRLYTPKSFLLRRLSLSFEMVIVDVVVVVVAGGAILDERSWLWRWPIWVHYLHRYHPLSLQSCPRRLLLCSITKGLLAVA